MKLATTIAVLAAATIGAASVALADSRPPIPRAAAGALPQAAVKAENRSARAQTAAEQKTSASAPAVPAASSRMSTTK
ncbi:MAG: hypothetical protein ACRECO_17920 [Xanthobacteraceae bacterium]